MKKTHLILGVLNGDDIGHEIVPAAVEVASAAAERYGLQIEWRPMPIGRRALETLGTTLSNGTLETLSQMDGCILGPIGHKEYPNPGRSIRIRSCASNSIYLRTFGPPAHTKTLAAFMTMWI